MKQVNRKNQRARPPPNKCGRAIFVSKTKTKRGKEYGIEICRARYG